MNIATIEVMSDSKMTEIPLVIPKLYKSELNALAERIKPVVRRGSSLYYVEPVDLESEAFTWNPKITGESSGLEEIASITTLHEYKVSVIFKPTIAEVLSQIPAKYQERTVAFNTAEGLDFTEDWPKAQRLAENHGFHLAHTILYAQT